MRCPMCLGKGYATDEDIKEYPHRCPNCNGKGFYSVDWQTVRCEVCNGSGKKPMTNEEWFCQLSTEEKAKFLAKKCCEISCKFFLGEAEEIFSRYWIEWLKKPHQRGDTE